MKKYENLMDIPVGSKGKLTDISQDRFQGLWRIGTEVVRGFPHSQDEACDDEYSVSFIFPDGDYHYLEAEDFELIEDETVDIPQTKQVWCIKDLEQRVQSLETLVASLQGQLANVVLNCVDDNALAKTIGAFSSSFLEEGKIYPVDSVHVPYKDTYPRYKHIRNKYEDILSNLSHTFQLILAIDYRECDRIY